MESIVTEYERPRRFNQFREPLPVQPPDVLRRRASNRTVGRTLRLLETYGFEATRRQFNADSLAVASSMKAMVAKLAAWDHGMRCDMRRWIDRQMAKNEHHLLELLTAVEVLNQAKQAASAA